MFALMLTMERTPSVPKVNLSQYQFTLKDPYHEGQYMGAVEANVLNYHRSDLIRKLVTKWVTDAEKESPDGVLTIRQLEKLIAAITLFDAQYELSPREEARLPAFDHQLRNIAISEVTRIGPSHLLPDFERRIEVAMRDPENREKARRQLVASIKSIFPIEAADG